MDLQKKLQDLTHLYGVYIKQSYLGGLGVFAAQDLKEDLIVMKTKKKNILSPKTCSISSILAEYEYLGPANLLILAYLFEKRQLDASPWRIFIELVESSETPDIPILWSPEEQHLLKATNIQSWEADTVNSLRENFETCMAEFQEKAQEFGKIEFKEWLSASLIISSRAFEVDDYHGLALVPGACLFNHSDRETVHFESDNNSVGWPTYSDTNDEWESCSNTTEPDGSDKENKNELCNSSIYENDVCEMRLIHAIKKDEEIFNTYGEDPNGVLLSRYGFAIWNNWHDIVDFDKEIRRLTKIHKVAKKLDSWGRQQEDNIRNNTTSGFAINDNENEQTFIGVINENGKPRLSAGLISFAKYLGLNAKRLASILAKEKYTRYAVTGSSSDIYGEILKLKSGRKQQALIAVGTEKLILENFLVKIL